MSISNSNPESNDVVIIQRDPTNSYYGETHISGSNLILYIDSDGKINADHSASFYTAFPPAGSTGGGGTTLYTGSTYQITASWSSQSLVSISSSWSSQSLSASYVKSSSWADTSSWATNAINGGTQLTTASTYQITSSWAVSASWASKSFSASYAPLDADYSSSVSFQFGTKQDTLIVGGNYQITSSWAADVKSASWASSSITASGIKQSTGKVYEAATMTSGRVVGMSGNYFSDSIIYDNGVTIGIGGVVGDDKLKVYGSVNAISFTGSITSSNLMGPAKAAISASWASASFIATSASWSSQSFSASYITASNVDGIVTYAATASYAYVTITGSMDILQVQIFS